MTRSAQMMDEMSEKLGLMKRETNKKGRISTKSAVHPLSIKYSPPVGFSSGSERLPALWRTEVVACDSAASQWWKKGSKMSPETSAASSPSPPLICMFQQWFPWALWPAKDPRRNWGVNQWKETFQRHESIWLSSFSVKCTWRAPLGHG